MEVKVLATSQANLVVQRNSLIVICLLILISNLCISIYLLKSDKQIILLPANLTRELDLSYSQLSESYIEEMTTFFLSKLLDITPENIDYQQKIVQRHIHPSFYKQMEKFFAEEKVRYAEYKLHSYFVIKELQIDPAKLQVLASGTLISQFGNTGKSQEQVTYKISYNYQAGLLTISDFSLVKVIENDKTKK